MTMCINEGTATQSYLVQSSSESKVDVLRQHNDQITLQVTQNCNTAQFGRLLWVAEIFVLGVHTIWIIAVLYRIRYWWSGFDRFFRELGARLIILVSQNWEPKPDQLYRFQFCLGSMWKRNFNHNFETKFPKIKKLKIQYQNITKSFWCRRGEDKKLIDENGEYWRSF